MTVCFERAERKGWIVYGGIGGAAVSLTQATRSFAGTIVRDTLRIFQSLIELCPGKGKQCICGRQAGLGSPRLAAFRRLPLLREKGSGKRISIENDCFFFAYLYNGFTVNLAGD